ncbi:MAG TPA: Trk system potassium transporter TrkA [Spirochaetota bacterium]|nr:Trk system potassium transporter TrkA [Spirochaetota bacterium]
MNIVIAGAGSVGFHIASQMTDENKDVTLIDRDPARASYAASHLDCLVINEEVNNADVLKKAGIARADFFISVTDSDEVNMIACGIVSSEFNVPTKIARVRNLDYSSLGIMKEAFLGINLIVNPEIEASRVISQTVSFGAMSDVALFEKTDVQLRNLFIDSSSILKNKSLKEIKKTLNEEFLIAGITRRDFVIIPSGETIVEENDKVHIAASQHNMEKVFAKTGKSTVPIKRVLLVGGGRISTLVARDLLRKGYTVKLIDHDYERCKHLSEIIPDALIINADISDEGVFEEERLFDNDLIISATTNQELNIISSIYAKSLGVSRAIAVVSKKNYLTIATELGIDATINPKSSTADFIIKYIRGSNIESVHSIFDGRAEVIEINIQGNKNVTGLPLKDLLMPDNSLIVSVTRNFSTIIPDGNFTLKDGDSVLVIANKKSINNTLKLFSKQK